MLNDKSLLLEAYEKYEKRKKQKDDLRSSLEFWKVFELIDKTSYEPLYVNDIKDVAMGDSFDILIEICEDLLGNLLIDNGIQFGQNEEETIVVLEYEGEAYRIIIDSEYQGINTRIQRVADREVLYSGNRYCEEHDYIEPICLTERVINDYVRYGNKPIEIRSIGFILNLFNGYRNMLGGKLSDNEKEVYEYVVRKLIEKDGRGED